MSYRGIDWKERAKSLEEECDLQSAVNADLRKACRRAHSLMIVLGFAIATIFLWMGVSIGDTNARDSIKELEEDRELVCTDLTDEQRCALECGEIQKFVREATPIGCVCVTSRGGFPATVRLPYVGECE